MCFERLNGFKYLKCLWAVLVCRYTKHKYTTWVASYHGELYRYYKCERCGEFHSEKV